MKNFGIVTMANGREILFMAVEGSFASEAWMKSDEAFKNTLGQTFSAITADDGKEYNIGRNVRRISEDEFSILFEQAHPAFKLRIQVEGLNLNPKSISKKIDLIQALEYIPIFVEKGYSEEEILYYFEKKYGE